MPHSSAVCSCTVRKRQVAVSFPNSNAPMVTFVLPASSASSTHTSRNNGFVRAVVLANYQEAVVIESGGGASQDRIALMHPHSFAAGVTGAAREQVDDGSWTAFDQHADVVVHCRQKGDEKLFARLVAAGFEAQGCGFFRAGGRKGGG